MTPPILYTGRKGLPMKRFLTAIVCILTGFSLRMSGDGQSETGIIATGLAKLEFNRSALSAVYPDICESVYSIVTNRAESANVLKKSLEGSFLERPEKTVVYVRDLDREAEENRKARESGRIEMFGAFKKKVEYPEETVRKNCEKNHLARLCILQWICSGFESLEENQQQALLETFLTIYLYEHGPRNILGTKDSIPVLGKMAEYAESEQVSPDIRQRIRQLLASIAALEQNIAQRKTQ